MDESPIIILGIDPGTRITGYGLIRLLPTGIEPIDYGCIRPPPTHPLPERYRIIFEAIEQLIGKFQPTVLAIETQFVLKNAQSAIKLGMARGMAVLAAARAKMEVHEYAPKRAKQAVVGNGSASKTQVQRMIGSLLGLPKDPEPEDAADALALAICYAHTNRIGKVVCTNSLKVHSSTKTR
jgi:crossover junction endodeoxyribonuclease RuvC